MASGRPQRESRSRRMNYAIDVLKDLQSDNEDGNPARASRVQRDAEASDSADEFAPNEDEEELEEEEEPVDEEDVEAARSELDDDEMIDVDEPRPRKKPGPRPPAITISASDLPTTPKGLSYMPAEQAKKVADAAPANSSKTIRAAHPSETIGPKMRQRLIYEWGFGGQKARYRDLFSPASEDLVPVIATREKWKTLEVLPRRSEGSPQRSFYFPGDAQKKETQITQDWYAEVAQKSFAKWQCVNDLGEDQGAPYLRNPGPTSLNLLLGDIKHQKVHTLKKGAYFGAAEPLKSDPRKRRGWIFNLGSRIQEARWAPGGDNKMQYLAVAVEQVEATDRPSKPKSDAPAFSATNPFPASIQIWGFPSSVNGDLDPRQVPQLSCVICTDWGAPKSFRWGPIAIKDLSDAPKARVRLGLLAGIWSDGKVRVLDVAFKPGTDFTKTQYLHFPSAAFEVTFPDSVPSCLQWLSGTSLAVASASGCLAVWSLNQPGTLSVPGEDPASRRKPTPWLYEQLSDTYILTLTSGYPSRPNFICITAADGFSRMFDLRASNFDMCSSIRGRALVLTQAWHEHTQTFIMPDEHYLLKHCGLRRFYSNHYTIRLEAPLACCATSPVHPCVLIACADGLVVASNPLMKVINSKRMPWQQAWFKHEWRPPIDQLVHDEYASPSLPNSWDPSKTRVASTAGNGQLDHTTTSLGGATEQEPQAATIISASASGVPVSALSQPLLRMTEGYKAVEANLQDTVTGQREKDGPGPRFVTIYDEKSCVTCLDWHPSVRFGAWAVAGMASGIMRVEDLGV